MYDYVINQNYYVIIKDFLNQFLIIFYQQIIINHNN